MCHALLRKVCSHSDYNTLCKTKHLHTVSPMLPCCAVVVVAGQYHLHKAGLLCVSQLTGQMLTNIVLSVPDILAGDCPPDNENALIQLPGPVTQWVLALKLQDTTASRTAIGTSQQRTSGAQIKSCSGSSRLYHNQAPSCMLPIGVSGSHAGCSVSRCPALRPRPHLIEASVLCRVIIGRIVEVIRPGSCQRRHPAPMGQHSSAVLALCCSTAVQLLPSKQCTPLQAQNSSNYQLNATH